MRRIVILAEGAFEWHYGKTATGVIRYGKDPVVAVIDSTKAGMDVAQALNTSMGKGIPVVRDINEALQYQPDTLLIGIAPMGGALPEAWRWQLLKAIDSGLNIISGLHFFISDDPELRAAALVLDHVALRRGLNSAFVAIGQTGIIISGNGLPVDRLFSDFIAGMVEE